MGRAAWLSWTMVHTLTPLCQGTWKTILLGHQTYVRPHRWTSHLHKSGECPYMTNWLHYDTDSSRWSLGLWWGSDSPCNPWFVQFCRSGPCDPRSPHDRPSCECDKRKWDGHTSDTLGQCLGSLPFDSMMSHCQQWKTLRLPLKCWTLLNMMKSSPP